MDIRERSETIKNEPKQEMNEQKLCYIKDGFAFFTSLELKDQWGDDWNDKPMECNAGEPYDQEDMEIIAFRGDFEDPDGFAYGSFTVEDVNKGVCAWLAYGRYGKNHSVVHAGASLKEFVEFVKINGGDAYQIIK